MAAAREYWAEHQEYLENAAMYKAHGNAAYKTKDLRKAIRNYHHALLLLKAVGLTVEAEFQRHPSYRLPKEMIEQRDQLKSECYNNLAACLLLRKNPDYHRIVEHCEKVLRYDATNVKAAYRKGTALFHLGQLDRARDVITSQPSFQSDKAMQTLLQSIKDKAKELEEEEEARRRSILADPPVKSNPTQAEPILIKNNVSVDCSGGNAMSARDDAANQNGHKLIHVACAAKEAAC